MAAVSSVAIKTAKLSTQKKEASLLQENDIHTEADLSGLPKEVLKQLKDLEDELKEGDLTEKGYQKKRSSAIAPYISSLNSIRNDVTIEELIEPDIENLPKYIVDELKNLQEELDEEEITQKGFLKKRSKILEPYMLKEPSINTLPSSAQKSYKELEDELINEEITEKGFQKKKIRLLRPYLVPVNPSSYFHIDASASTICKTKNLKSIQVMLSDGNKEFECNLCGERFKHAQSFSGHCRLHRNEKKMFKCSVCSSSYTSKSHLKYHMYKHTGDFPYTCQYCGKGFAGKSQHRYHELRHSGESPFTCELCGSRFWKLKNFEAHKSKPCLVKPSGGIDDEDGTEKSCAATFDSQDDFTDSELPNRIRPITMADLSVQHLSP